METSYYLTPGLEQAGGFSLICLLAPVTKRNRHNNDNKNAIAIEIGVNHVATGFQLKSIIYVRIYLVGALVIGTLRPVYEAYR